MSQVGQLSDTWPGGLTYVFQGTIAEDATAGTHVCTVTLTPGVGNEFRIVGGEVTLGNTATAMIPRVYITDGTNVLNDIVTAVSLSSAANAVVPFPSNANSGATMATSAAPGWHGGIVSGTMRLVLQVSTTAVSVTQTFAVILRIHGEKPTVVLADTVGTPTLTTNTDAVF